MAEAQATHPSSIEVPSALRFWFVVHFVADIIFAIPLMFMPEAFLGWCGWKCVDPISARLVAAALFGIGIESLISRNADIYAFRSMLGMKVIWSFTAFAGIGLSLLEGAHGRPLMGWGFFATFVGFHGLWLYWRITVGKIIAKHQG